ncbi:DUF2878 domain-containing protein [Pseudoalteromonas rubra]|uniref:DUF2878 domain-containing protein n=1 Tax=Pseudoalteromonas rubra TaxID=43658 RepID=UPI002DB77DDF|nr:DUF2878 domain-containing protein [Pseudoalteromonas rubra]MEC4089275.1 DUF2878 domain-containing protein [Pseudoalteromonas rubra]
MMRNFWLINLIIFQSVWWLCALFTDQAVPLVGLLFLLHFALSPSRKADARSLLILPLGLIVDQSLSLLGVISFADGYQLLPLWLALLWGHFTLTLNHSLSWMSRYHFGIQGALGAVFGALSYIGGIKLGALNSALSLTNVFLIFAVVWAVILPLVVHLNGRMGQRLGVQHV